MNWSDEGYILSVRRHGEGSAIVNLLTRMRGRHAGLVRGGMGRRLRGVLQPGNHVVADWRGRLPEHLGTLAIESKRDYAAALMADGDRLAGLMATTAVTEAVLPERQPQLHIYDAFASMMDVLATSPDWTVIYVRYELGLLAELGFGLDLHQCVATGVTENLAFVSPRSARAVSREAAEPYKNRLLPLPGFLLPDWKFEYTTQDILDGLILTGYFLEATIYTPNNRSLPAARDRLASRLAQSTKKPVTL